MVAKTSERGVMVTGVVGDDNTTTVARLKKSFSHKIEKKSDKNHVRKNISNQLNQLKTSHKGLSSKVTSYIMKPFNYCIASNRNDPLGISKGLDAVVNHVRHRDTKVLRTFFNLITLYLQVLVIDGYWLSG